MPTATFSSLDPKGQTSVSTWFITGCSSGLGRATAQVVLGHGHNAVVTARNAATLRAIGDGYPDTAQIVELDVTDEAQVTAAVAAATSRFGGVDVLVNNAGYGYRAAVEEGENADVDRLFATNFFGPVSLIKAVLPGMRSRRTGAIVNVSSLGTRITPAGSGYYVAAKAALEGMSASLRKEVEPLGITVIVAQPGQFRTDFAGRSLTQSPSAIADYAETAGKRRIEKDDVHGTQKGDPARAAQAIITAVEAPDPPFLLLLGTDAVEQFRITHGAQSVEVDKWQELSVSTDFDA